MNSHVLICSFSREVENNFQNFVPKIVVYLIKIGTRDPSFNYFSLPPFSNDLYFKSIGFPLVLEDHQAINAVPKWLLECGQDLKKTCSGHPVPRDPMVLCERETKWSEKFLQILHEDLKSK